MSLKCLLALIYFKCERYDETEIYLKEIIKNSKDVETSVKVLLGDTYAKKNNYRNALAIYEEIIKNYNSDDLEVKIANCLYNLNETEKANNMVMKVLNKDQNNFEALLTYANKMYENLQMEDSLRVSLKLLVLQPNNKYARFLFSKIMKHKESFQLLENELKEATIISKAAALAFLAMIIKEYGLIQLSTKLYLIASTLNIKSVTYCLNYVHNLELFFDYITAIDSILLFLKNNSNNDVFNLKGLETDHFYKVINNIYKNNECETLPLVSSDKQITQYTSEQLDYLALLFTLVKICYLNGLFKLAFPLVKLIETLRTSDLHLTTIRNENAYFSCIQQLLPYHNNKNYEKNNNFKPIYVIGDSHCLALAYQTIQKHTKESGEHETKNILIPRLVTGMKIWHLRDESVFYTKFNFKNAVEKSNFVLKRMY